MTKFVIAPAGTNPMEIPELIARKKTSKLKLFGMIALGLLALTCVCAVPAYFVLRPKPTAVKAEAVTPTSAAASATPSPTPPAAIVEDGDTAGGYSRAMPLPAFPTFTLAPARTATPWVINREVVREVTRIVNQPGQPYPVVTVETIYSLVGVKETVIVTATPGPTNTPEPTQTPWIVYVEVTSTPTETLTPTFTPEPPTITPSGDPIIYPTETPTLGSYPAP